MCEGVDVESGEGRSVWEFHEKFMLFLFLFFFSSRRRHTRLVSDWSSDVCSSDLLSKCASFKSLPREQRFSTAKGLRACNRCLSVDHFIGKCVRDWTCGVCKSSSHHTLLHKARDIQTEKTTPKEPVTTQVLDSFCVDTITNACNSRLFTKTVPVWLSSNHQPNKEILTYALLDDHSKQDLYH